MSSIVDVPLFKQLEGANKVLISGCGGGFDVYCGLPLALALWRQGKSVVLGNLTFATPRSAIGAHTLGDALTRIDSSMKSVTPYFPEWYLACWLKRNGHPDSVYCFERTGVIPLRRAYESLIEREAVDAVVLVDGGTDSLMRGDEPGLGTPHEDVASLVALEELDLPKFLVCLGFGIDAFHGVCHTSFLENSAALARLGAFLGTFSVLPEQQEGRAYLDAVQFATALESSRASIVNTSIAAAVEGKFGDHHSTSRTRGSKLFINPLMGIYWCYELGAVIDQLLYKEHVRATNTFSDILVHVEAYRKSLSEVRPRRAIPG